MEESPNFEQPVFHYIYVDNSITGHPIVYECDAVNIMEADEKYELVIGEKPEKQNHIGCSIVKI